MNEIDKLIEDIKQTLRIELPDRYMDSLDQFTALTDKDLLRASYDVLDCLRRKQDFHISTRLQGLIDKYKVVF